MQRTDPPIQDVAAVADRVTYAGREHRHKTVTCCLTGRKRQPKTSLAGGWQGLLRTLKTPQTGSKHRLGEMSTGFYNFGVPELAYKFRDS